MKAWGDDKDFVSGDLASCEKSVLKKMEVDDDLPSQVRQKVSDAIKKELATDIAKAAAMVALRQVIKIVAAQVAKQIARAVLLRIISSINPILAALALIDLAGPATRKTIPSVTYVALMRQLYRAHVSGL